MGPLTVLHEFGVFVASKAVPASFAIMDPMDLY